MCIRDRLNQAFFEKLYIDHGEVTDHVLAEPFGEIVEGQRGAREPKRPKRPTQLKTRGRTSPASSGNPFLDIYQGRGSSKTVMVGAEGLEPPTCWL